jgi:hypothetical protein
MAPIAAATLSRLRQQDVLDPGIYFLPCCGRSCVGLRQNANMAQVELKGVRMRWRSGMARSNGRAN